MGIERKKTFLIQAAYYGSLVLIAGVFCKYLLSPLSPFIAGFVIAWFLHKPAKILSKKLHLFTRIPAMILTIAFYIIFFAAILIAGLQIISALEHFVPQIPALYTRLIVPFITETFETIEMHLQEYDPSVVSVFDRIARELFAYLEKLIGSLSVSAVRLVSSVVTGLPTVILSVIVTVVSTFFISLDYDHIVGFMKNCLPRSMQSTVSETITTGLDSIRKVLGSYILIMMLSFAELSVGFLLLNVPYAVGIALLVAVIDIMPILGTGLVLIPWALIAAVLRKFRMAIGIAFLYIFMLAVRNVVEPRLVGKQMGLHPLVTLISMFVGLQLFGIVGLFGFPITLSLYLKFRNNQKASA
ncbi:MAG: sporulation integral membrane protein YtvI [Clostridia bacterium]|nr:sporulation integral membrane protein YtvI [Clostridia bacterium]